MKQSISKQKRCKVCNCMFMKTRKIQPTCNNYECQRDYALSVAAKSKERRDKAARAKTREVKERLKTRSEHMKEAQAAFNEWVRARDYGNPCISCGRQSGCKVNAGHYRSVGAQPALRFHPDNVHLQCEHCNKYLSSNAIEYRIRLVQKIGIEKVEWLEKEHEPQKLAIEVIKEIKQHYRKLARELKKMR